ncbi:hypothetical protein HG535_0D01930 [Zygotorulaspora mrakii]|uniref:Uncharacterized protein n=1 Tax=Zygotorulaspora mrakii TaxID=42260 RepID=A0A7H9B1E4_ZYGMR|nr:uncharacterized protein HG535_0D01930 [Zygotorulaspora mrakii]QLG72485.1 hypothetical protein HG535_0D01930 [Zygotorulaspora mrakii]
MENPADAQGRLKSPVPEKPNGKQLFSYTDTPTPALLNCSMLLLTPIISPATVSPVSVAQRSASSRLANMLTKPKYLGPTKKTALLFGGAQALGAWMIHDGDLESGCGFLAAWSTLYLIVGGRGSLKSLRYGKVWPLMLSTISLGNAYLYGRRFISGGFS